MEENKEKKFIVRDKHAFGQYHSLETYVTGLERAAKSLREEPESWLKKEPFLIELTVIQLDKKPGEE